MKDPDLASCIGGLTLMGGHLRKLEYGGCVFPHGIDYNLCSDPHAAFLLLRSGIPTRLVTADVTLRVWLREKDVRRIEQAGTRFHDALARAIRIWTPVMDRLFGAVGARMDEDNVAFLHDPLTIAAAHDESFCTFEELEVEPAIQDGTLFRTIEHAAPAETSFPMRCATDAQPERFRDYFVDRVCAFRPR
jgi:purine nucleosidase